MSLFAFFDTATGRTFGRTPTLNTRSVRPKMRPVIVMKKGKKDRNFHRSNWLFAQTTQAPETLHAGSCPGSSYIVQDS